MKLRLKPPVVSSTSAIDPFALLIEHQRSVLFPPGHLAYLESQRQQREGPVQESIAASQESE